MSYGPPPLARSAQHAERLYWARNPPKRRAGELTATEAAQALGITPVTAAKWAKAGKLGDAVKRNGQWFFRESQIADFALAKVLR